MPSKILTSLFISIIILTFNAKGQELSKAQAQQIADRLLLIKKYKAPVKLVLAPVNRITLILTEPPYREYPSIILVRQDKATKAWKPITECLSPGIQDQPSGKIDWHTLNKGVDFQIGDDKTYNFNGRTVRSTIDVGLKSKALIIPYQNFIHMHDLGGTPPASFFPYTIDKTSYYDLANKLFDDLYKKYPTDNCVMYDTPKISGVTFNYVDGKYAIVAKTNNGQNWVYTFDGVDADGRFLINKKISAKNFL